MKKIILPVIMLAVVFGAQTAGADTICLTNGNIIEGIVLQDTDGILEVEVFLDAKITFAKTDIAYVKEWNEDDNYQLRAKWKRDKEERKEAELARQIFEAQQAASGLVKYHGKWIPKEEKDKLKTQEYIDEALREKADRGEIAESGERKRTELARALLAKGNWRYRQTEHFIIYYEDVVQSKMVADRAEYYYEKICYDLDYEKTIYWPEKCEVFIIPSEEKWEEYMQGFMQRFDHIGGFVPRTGEREIYLCALSLPYLSVTFPHELTHLIFMEFVQGEYIPLWLNEGLAIYESGLIGYADEMLREKVKAAEHIPVMKFVQMKNYPATKEEVELYYAQAEKIVEFLITQHGRRKFSRFCSQMVADPSFEKALSSVYEEDYHTPDDFKRAWIKYVLK